jgi:hypothetical protein
VFKKATIEFISLYHAKYYTELWLFQDLQIMGNKSSDKNLTCMCIEISDNQTFFPVSFEGNKGDLFIGKLISLQI